MSQVTLFRTDKALPANMDSARDLLFGALDGWSFTDKKTWRNCWRRLLRLEPGEMARIEICIPRNSKFHRKFFILLNVGFDYWESGRKRKTYKGKPVKANFEVFRDEIIILAGFYEQTFNLRGKMKLKAQSISFANMEEPEFEALYGAVADVLLDHILTNYAGRNELDDVVEKVMRLNQ